MEILTCQILSINCSTWLGYPASENSWEPEKSIPKHLIQQYQSGNGDQLMKDILKIATDNFDSDDTPKWIDL